MSIEVTWTEEPEDLSHYSGDDEYEFDQDNGNDKDNDYNDGKNNNYNGIDDYEFQDRQEPPLVDEERWKQIHSLRDISNRKLQKNGEEQHIMTETTGRYLVSTSREQQPHDSYLCGLASAILEQCDPRVNKVDDAATQITVTTQMDEDRKDRDAQSGMLLRLLSLDEDDNNSHNNRSFDRSIRSTRTSDSHETERTAIETEWARPEAPVSRKSSFRPISPFQKWSRPTSPIQKEKSRAKSPVTKTPSPPVAYYTPQDIQREISLLEVEEADEDLRALGISPTPPHQTPKWDGENSIVSMSPVPDDASLDSYDPPELLADPRNEKHVVKPVQSIEVIYDPNEFEDIDEGKRCRALWPIGVKKSRSRSRYYR